MQSNDKIENTENNEVGRETTFVLIGFHFIGYMWFDSDIDVGQKLKEVPLKRESLYLSLYFHCICHRRRDTVHAAEVSGKSKRKVPSVQSSSTSRHRCTFFFFSLVTFFFDPDQGNQVDKYHQNLHKETFQDFE